MSTLFRIPRYCIHTAKQLAYVRLNEEMIYLGPPGSPQSKAQYDRLIAEWIAGGRTYIKPSEREGVSVNEILLAYRRFAETYYANADGPNAAELERINLAIRPITELYGDTTAKDFGPRALKTVRDKMIAQNLCRLTINQRIGCIRRIFAWAVEEELIPPSVSHGLNAVRGLKRGRSGAKESRHIGPVAEQVVDAVMKHLPPTLQAMVKLHDLTGMRSGELVIMRTCDIQIPEQNQPWLYCPQKHKTMNHGHRRVVLIGPMAQEILRPLLKRDVQTFIFTPSQAQVERNIERRAKRKTKVQPSQASRKKKAALIKQPGERYTSASYRRALAYATDQAIKAGDLPPGTAWRPYQLRHNCASRIRRVGGLDAVRAVLGHRSVVQSAEYAEIDAALAAKTAAAVG